MRFPFALLRPNQHAVIRGAAFAIEFVGPVTALRREVRIRRHETQVLVGGIRDRIDVIHRDEGFVHALGRRVVRSRKTRTAEWWGGEMDEEYVSAPHSTPTIVDDDDRRRRRRLTTDDRRPTTDDRRPTTDDRRPTTDDQRPTTNNRRRRREECSFYSGGANPRHEKKARNSSSLSLSLTLFSFGIPASSIGINVGTNPDGFARFNSSAFQ
jgi:hypothetical protein